MDIVRNADGTLVVPVRPERQHDAEEAADGPAVGDEAGPANAEPATRVLHPGEGGSDEALAEWDLQQNPDRPPVVSTAGGRQEAMAIVHAVATSAGDEDAVSAAVEAVADPEASGEALRHVLVGGVHSVEDFAAEVAEAEGGDPLPPHETTKIIGEILSELDK